jgi:hypothetical protein
MHQSLGQHAGQHIEETIALNREALLLPPSPHKDYYY